MQAMAIFKYLFVVSLCFLTVLGSPVVTVKNGTLRGIHSNEWDQDYFLGIPYAQPPVGDLRFRWPRSIEKAYDGDRDATQYSYSCYQYGYNFNMSEDCLTLNGELPQYAPTTHR